MSNFNSIYTRLLALSQNLPDSNLGVESLYVNEYHGLLNELGNLTNLSLEEYRIPNSAGREIQHFRGFYYPKPFVKAKLDAILMLFQVESEGKVYGFRSE